MKKRAFKLLICICVISCLMVGFCTSFASAVVVGGSGLLGSALGSLGVDLLAGGSATAATLAPWLNGEYSIRGVITGVADGFIKVNDDSVFIDGVEYQSIFLDPSIATELHTQAFDFITQKAIISNSSGILATGVGYLGDTPVYNVSGELRTQEINASDVGSYAGTGYYFDIVGYATVPGYLEAKYYYDYSGASTTPFASVGSNASQGYNFASYSSVVTRSGTDYLRVNVYAPSSSQWRTYDHYLSDFGANYYVNSPFDYSYVSGNIDATPLPSNYGFSAYVPKADLADAGIVAGTYYNDSQLAIVNELIDLLDQAYADEAIKNAQFAEEGQPVPPAPTTTIADTAYTDLQSELTQIKNNQAHANTAVDNIDTNIDVIGRTVDHLDDTVTDIEGYIQTGTTDIVDSVDTAGQAVVDGLSDVEGAIDTYGQSVVSGLDSVETAVDTAGQSVVDSVDAQTQALEQSIADVADKVESLDTTVDEVIEKVESHPLDLFGAFLDRLTQIPVIKDLFDGIKQHVGIWHYVVEWLQCIGSFLAFFIGLFSDVAYCMVVPIYACVAGAICLAFYKRFGR